MATVVPKTSGTKFSDVNGFYRVEAQNLGLAQSATGYTSAVIPISATAYSVTLPVTFANAGNCMGIMVVVFTSSSTGTRDRGFVVELQENVAGTWTTRTSETITALQLRGDQPPPHQGYYNRIIGIDFTTPYAVDTAASKWRFNFYRYGGTTSELYLVQTGTNAPTFATWCDTAVSLGASDTLCVTKRTIVDQSQVLDVAALGTGDTITGFCCVIAGTIDQAEYMLDWENPPTSSYELEFKGNVMFGDYSSMRVGSEASPIPLAQQAIISFNAGSLGTYGNTSTQTPGFKSAMYLSPSYITCNGRMVFWGSYPTKFQTKITAEVATGQKDISVEDDMTALWSAGDKIVVSKQESTAADQTIYEIASLTSTTITTTANIATNKRYAGGYVLKLGGCGVRIYRKLNDDYFCHLTPFFGSLAEMTFNGVELQNMATIANSYTLYYIRPKPEWQTKHSLKNIVTWDLNTSAGYLISLGTTPEKGIEFENIYTFRRSLDTNRYFPKLKSYGFLAGEKTVKNLYMHSPYIANEGIQATGAAGLGKQSYENVYMWDRGGSSSQGSFFLHSIGGSYKNINLWGMRGTNAAFGALRIGQCVDVVVDGVNIDNCYLGVNADVYFTKNLVIKDLAFGGVIPSVLYDLSGQSGIIADITFENAQGMDNRDSSFMSAAVAGSMIKFTDFDGSSHDDQVYAVAGKLQRCGDSLTDTTVHTSGTGKYSLRFEPDGGTIPHDWTQNVPTGNIQNKDMSVAVWVKINNANYYAGTTYQLPMLTINYDDGTTATCLAAKTTDWQKLFVPFTPLTTYGKITVKIDGYTDATGSAAYFYIDDCSILYPAGYALNLSGLDDWSNGLPVTPTISQVVADAGTVWDAKRENHTVTDSFGNDVYTVPSDMALH